MCFPKTVLQHSYNPQKTLDFNDAHSWYTAKNIKNKKCENAVQQPIFIFAEKLSENLTTIKLSWLKAEDYCECN